MIKDKDVWDIKRVLVHQNDERRLVVTAGLRLKPYSPGWSVTAEEWTPDCTDDCSSCGCLHEEILKAFPELKPVIDVHLSDPDGTPMHAVANATYWLEEGKRETLYSHLRWSDDNIAKANAVFGTTHEDLWTLLRVRKALAQDVDNPKEALTADVQLLVDKVLRAQWTDDISKAREVLESFPENTKKPPTPLQAAIDKHNIRMTVVGEEWDYNSNMRKYIIRLRKGRKSMTTRFSTGAAHEGVSTEEVLGCCIRDARDVEYAGSFEEWCANYGFDEDSREAKRNYNACLKIGEKLQRVLGDVYEQVATPGL